MKVRAKMWEVKAVQKIYWTENDFETKEEFEAFEPSRDEIINTAKDLEWDEITVREMDTILIDV